MYEIHIFELRIKELKNRRPVFDIVSQTINDFLEKIQSKGSQNL